MNLEEVRIAIKQLGEQLYEDNPERQARGPFSVDKYDGPMTREQKLADVEAYQAEMLEKQVYRDALMDLEDSLVEASPSVGEKLIADFINLYPMGKRGSAGIGSLLGKEIGGMSEAEALRIKDIEQKIYELNSVYQKEGRGLKEIEALEGEKQGIMSILSETPLSDEPIFSPDENQYQPSPRDEADQAAALIKQKELDESAGTFLNRIEQEMDSSYDEFLGPDETPLSPKTQARNVRDWQDVPLSHRDGDKQIITFLEEHNFREYDGYGPKTGTFQVFEDRIVAVDPGGSQKTFRNATLKSLRDWMGYQAGGYVMNYGDYGRNYK
tara:strand:+ start:50 stop:1024 length:975 start_codon:yes stop_codon:yes gene_type:complete